MLDRHPTGLGRAVRDLQGRELPASSALHARALPDGFFARLGPRFLRTYHRSFVESPHAVALVSTDAGAFEGFLLAVLDPAPHGAYVLRRWGPELAVRGAVALLARPAVLVLFLRTRLVRYARGLWRRGRRPATPSRSSGRAVEGEWAVLSHIAVDDALRGAGAGAALVRALHERAAAAGATGVVLLTAVDGAAPSFYRRLQYEDEGVVKGSDGRPWLRFRHRLR